jgi:hypothetical protein
VQSPDFLNCVLFCWLLTLSPNEPTVSDMHFDGTQRNRLPENPTREPESINVHENPAFNLPAKIGYFVFFIGMCASGAGIITLLVRGNEHPWKQIASIAIGTILIFGPMIGGIVWATRRHSRRVRQGQ